MAKSNKGYAAALLAIQMGLVPLILTLGLFPAGDILGRLLDKRSGTWPGADAVNLIYILTALLGPLIVGGAAGCIFSAFSKSKPDSAKARYMTPGLPIIYALVFAVLAQIFSGGNFNSGWWGIYALKNPVLLIFNFAVAFTGLHFVMPVAEIAGYTGFAGGFMLQELVSGTALKGRPAVRFKALLGILSAAFIIFTCISTGEIINNGIIEFRYGKSTVGNELTEFDLMNVAPFKENNGLAKLEGKASLQFTDFDDMPRLDGATAAYPVYAAFVEAVYQGLGDYYRANRNNNDKNIYEAFVSSKDYPLSIVRCSKTAEAYARLIHGETDIIFAAEPSEAQIEMVKAKGDEFVLTPIGSEAFVFFTNVNNPVENLTVGQLQDIYSGRIKNWKEAGGPNKRILPYQRPENSGSQTIMQNKVMKGIEMLAPTKETRAGGMGEVISRVADYKNAENAIGYSFMYYSSAMIKNNQIKYIAVDGVKPAPESVRNKKYPFTVPVYAVTLKSNTNANVGKMIDWILSGEGQSLIEKTGYVPVKSE